MVKKARLKQETKESIALKKMRAIRELSQAKTAELLNVSKTCVNHYEGGWDSIPSSYISKFIKALKFKRSDWEYILNNDKPAFRLRSNCITVIDKLNEHQLQIIHNLLKELI